MSMHKVPLTELEREGLVRHGLARRIGKPDQLIDVFRQGVAWALSQQLAEKTSSDPDELLDMPFVTEEQKFRFWQAAKKEVKALRHDLDSYMTIANEYANSSQSVEVLLEALQSSHDFIVNNYRQPYIYCPVYEDTETWTKTRDALNAYSSKPQNPVSVNTDSDSN